MILALILAACISSPPVDTSMPDDTASDTSCYEVRWLRDADGDGYGAWDPAFPDTVLWLCVGFVPSVPGYVLADGDCDDTRRDTYPGAPDPGGDGLDSDCDGVP